jgi:hypothetical protein
VEDGFRVKGLEVQVGDATFGCGRHAATFVATFLGLQGLESVYAAPGVCLCRTWCLSMQDIELV